MERVLYFAWKSQRSEPLSDLALANVAALARGESEGWDDCEDGCSAKNTGKYCCTLIGHDL